MSLQLDVQIASESPGLPSPSQFENWLEVGLQGLQESAQLTIRVVDLEEGAALNEQWRNRQGATNVLSFPATDEKQFMPDLLGDVVICAPVVEREAQEQGKPLEAHWAHLVIHGLLHLLGYDHQDDVQANTMESMETGILATLNYPDPYQTTGIQ